VAGDEADGPAGGPIDLARLNTGIPHPARVYDVWLGGKDNFAADRAAAEAGLQAFPSTIKSVRANRAFLARTVRYLVQEEGLRQLLDIGTGLPSANNPRGCLGRRAGDQGGLRRQRPLQAGLFTRGRWY
jgi:S-adenosyl methyltransferase